MLIILSSIFVSLSILLFLVYIIIYAEGKLLPQGKVKILINNDEDKSPSVSPGSTLLSALSASNIFIPSACGGGGTCAMCLCKIHKGGGEILSTELNHISRKEAKQDWRLACQVKVREDMEVTVPEEIFNIQKWECTVKSNLNVATFIKELVLELPSDTVIDFEAGGYIQIDVPKYNISFKNIEIQKEYHEDWDKYKIWDLKANNDEPVFRAYSMANHPGEKNVIKLNIRIATPPPKLWNDVPPGKASTYTFNLKPGDKVLVSGPYGDFFIKDTNREMVYIGGGAGMAPLRSHLFHLFHSLKTKRKVSYWYGARSSREMFYDNDFKEIQKKYPNFSYNVALSDKLPEDNWDGYEGFIHQVLLDNYLDKHEDPTEVEYYMCGPPMMIQAVQSMLYDLGVEPDMIAFDDFG